jgi:hypothetical protein
MATLDNLPKPNVSPEDLKNLLPESDPFYSAVLGYTVTFYKTVFEFVGGSSDLFSDTKKELIKWLVAKKNRKEETAPLSSLAKSIYKVIAEDEIPKLPPNLVDKYTKIGQFYIIPPDVTPPKIVLTPPEVNRETLKEKSKAAVKAGAALFLAAIVNDIKGNLPLPPIPEIPPAPTLPKPPTST